MTGKVDLVGTDGIKMVVEAKVFELFEKMYSSCVTRVEKKAVFFDFFNDKHSTHSFGLDRLYNMIYITVKKQLIN